MTGPMSAIKKFDNASQNNTSTVINNEEIKKIITQLETDLVNGTWTHKDYGKNDMKIMPALITQANNKYPEMNAHYILYPRDLSITIKRTIEKRIKSARFIISMGSDGIHFAVIDYKHINNNTSVILFEPAKFKGSGASLLALRARMSIQRNPLPDCHFSVVEMDIQRSSSECGIFSLALAKKLYLEQDSLLKIHEDNIKGILYDSNSVNYLPCNGLDAYLPVTFYKHTQSKKRLEQYFRTHWERIGTIINKKNQTICDRLSQNQSVINGKDVSISIYKKRIAEYKALVKS